MAFYEQQFPVQVSLGSRGGPNWMTVVTTGHSGREVRNQKWEDVRCEYDVSWGIKVLADLQAVRDLFNEMRGRAHGFRYKDWLDYSVTDEALVPDGTNTVQLIKSYGNGDNDYARDIKKPIAGVTMERNSVAFATFSLDTTTGIATLTALSSANVSAVTPDSPTTTTTITTSSAHGYTNGETIYLNNLGGMDNTLNGNAYVISGASGSTFTITADSSADTYTSGGTAEKHVQPSDTLTWTGEFDVPVRFDIDSLDVTLETTSYGATSIPLVELKL